MHPWYGKLIVFTKGMAAHSDVNLSCLFMWNMYIQSELLKACLIMYHCPLIQVPIAYVLFKFACRYLELKVWINF